MCVILRTFAGSIVFSECFGNDVDNVENCGKTFLLLK